MKTRNPEHIIKFIGTHQYEGQATTIVNLETDAVTLDDVLLEFEQFLKAMGYNFKGHIDIYDPEAED